MKELKVYLGFFRNNFLLFVLLSIVGLAGGYLYSLTLKEIYSASAVIELQYTNENVEKKKLETDELVGVLRGADLNQLVGLSDVQPVEIYKPGPISLNVKLVSSSQAVAAENLDKISAYIFSHTTAKLLSRTEVQVSRMNFVVLMALGFTLGCGCAFVLALLKEYLRLY